MRLAPLVRHPLLAGATALLAQGAVQASTWFPLDAVGQTSSMAIEVDTDSLRPASGGREVMVRVSYARPRVHASGAKFRSVVTTVEVRCDGGLAGYRDATYYAEAGGRGAPVAREEREASVPDATRALLPRRSLEQLTRAACTQPTPATR